MTPNKAPADRDAGHVATTATERTTTWTAMEPARGIAAGDTRSAAYSVWDGDNGKHLRGTETAADVATHAFANTMAHADIIQEVGGILAVFGSPGLGKTFATRTYLAKQSPQPIYIPFAASATHLQLVKRLHRMLIADPDLERRGKRSAETFDLVDEVGNALAWQRRIIVIDEAAFLTVRGLQTIRSLHDRPDARWSLFIVGTNVDRRLRAVPELLSRVNGKVEFTPFTLREITEHLHAYHPVFANTNDDVIEWLFRNGCGGRFRAWATILQRFLERQPYFDFDDRITQKIAVNLQNSVHIPDRGRAPAALTRVDRNVARMPPVIHDLVAQGWETPRPPDPSSETFQPSLPGLDL